MPLSERIARFARIHRVRALFSSNSMVPGKLLRATPPGRFRGSALKWLPPILLWIAALLSFGKVFAALPGRINHYDFSLYYVSALELREHVDPYTADVSSLGDKLGFEVRPLVHAVDSPSFLVFFEPLTLL